MNAPTTDRVLSVVFTLRGESYVMPAADVVKIVEPSRMNRLPKLPRAIVGITQHRGRVITVVDLPRVLFGDAHAESAVTSPPRHVLLIDRGQRNAGIVADAIEEIAPVRMSGARPAAVDALRVVQHRGRAVNAIVTDALVHAIFALAPTGPEP